MEKTPTEKLLGPMHGPKMQLTNTSYYDEITAEMAAMQKPRVRHAMEAMHRKGNGAYVRSFKQIDPLVLEETFGETYTLHEITHIAGRIGHTPDQEFLGMAMEFGALYGTGLKDAHPTELKAHKKQMAEAQTYYEKLWSNAHLPETKYTPTSKRDVAIYTAAGMYLRQKIDAYVQGAEDLRYDAQRDFCNQYALADSVPVKQSAVEADVAGRMYFDRVRRAPYDLLHISKAEWRAIEGVALGMRAPEQTLYPKRMEAIKQALVATELFFDRPNFTEQLRAGKIAKEQGMKTSDPASGRG